MRLPDAVTRILVGLTLTGCDSSGSVPCAPYVRSATEAGTKPAPCDESSGCTDVLTVRGTLLDGAVREYDLCTISCADAGDPCAAGAVCTSPGPGSTTVSCFLSCGGDAGPCPSPLDCDDAGVCR
jgi:hypothetical protein